MAGNERRRGPGCERSGTCTVEARSLHNWAEGEGCCGVRKDLVLCMVKCKGSVLDRSAMMSDERSGRVYNGISALTSGG